MSRSRALLITTLTTLGAAAALPAAASAACANVPFRDLVTGADVVATVEFLAGDADASGTLRTPARAKVLRYDLGSGPQEVGVSTALGALAFGSEGITPKAGETWRLYGNLTLGDSLGTSICAGSIRMAAQPAAASVVIGGKARALAPSSIAGKPHSGALQAVRLPKNGSVTVKAVSPAADSAASQAVAARLVQPGKATRTLKVSWTGRSSAISGKLPKLTLGKKGATLVIVTREAAFAIALRKPA